MEQGERRPLIFSRSNPIKCLLQRSYFGFIMNMLIRNTMNFVTNKIVLFTKFIVNQWLALGAP